MTESPSPLQTLILWRLLASGGSGFAKELKPELKPKDRDTLRRKGLIELEKRLPPGITRGRRLDFVALTDKGWEWAANHLDAEISPKSTAAGPILRDILSKLKAHLVKHQLSLADFICGATPPTSGNGLVVASDIPERIRRTYLSLSHGQWHVHVRLSDLRDALPDIPRDRVDSALMRMEAEKSVVFFAIGDPQDLHFADKQAALSNSVGDPRHVIYMKG